MQAHAGIEEHWPEPERKSKFRPGKAKHTGGVARAWGLPRFQLGRYRDSGGNLPFVPDTAEGAAFRQWVNGHQT